MSKRWPNYHFWLNYPFKKIFHGLLLYHALLGHRDITKHLHVLSNIIFFVIYKHTPPRHVHHRKAMSHHIKCSCRAQYLHRLKQRTTHRSLSQCLLLSSPTTSVAWSLLRPASFLLSPIGKYRGAKETIIFVCFFGRLPLRQPTACRCTPHTKPVITL